jgi:hypothetical protein
LEYRNKPKPWSKIGEVTISTALPLSTGHDKLVYKTGVPVNNLLRVKKNAVNKPVRRLCAADEPALLASTRFIVSRSKLTPHPFQQKLDI